ncbi:MAG: hypothetical protein ACLUAR_12910 [Pilosibacter sp.]
MRKQREQSGTLDGGHRRLLRMPGKSAALNKLTGAGILAEDKLLATLDPTTTRRLMSSG